MYFFVSFENNKPNLNEKSRFNYDRNTTRINNYTQCLVKDIDLPADQIKKDNLKFVGWARVI